MIFFLMILVDVLLFKDPDPGGRKVPDPLDPGHCYNVIKTRLDPVIVRKTNLL